MRQRQSNVASPIPPLVRLQRISCLVLTGLLTAPLTLSANIPSNPFATHIAISESPYAAHRERYQQAETAFSQGKLQTFRRIAGSLKDYPLFPYLQYKDYRRQLGGLDQQQVRQFMQNNDGIVVSEWLRDKLIEHYARNRQWQPLIDTYRPASGIAEECRYLEALIHTGQSALAMPRVESLWLSPSSRPGACDDVFNLWDKQGHKTAELVWQRFRLAISSGNRQLAGYLIRSMTGTDAHIARQWIKLHRSPQDFDIRDIRKLKHRDQPSIMVHWLKRLSSRDIERTIEHYHQLKQYSFSVQQHAEIIRRIGLTLARKHMPDAGIWLARVPDSQIDRQVREWRIRTAIRQGDWSMVINAISRLKLHEQAKHRWQYWWAYANEELGNRNDALGIYQYLSSKRSYYGFLAADRLNLDYHFEDRPVAPEAETMAYIRQQPETIRAREFYLMNRLLPARREWQRLISRLDTEQKLAASKLAQLWGWHDRAIVTMGKTRYRDDIELRFPLHHQSKVHTWSSRHNIDPAWTYAIIRRESAFVPDARSPVGAMGLMQLMPATARQMARALKIRYPGYRNLLASNTNIRLGTGYLEAMLEKLNQQVLATAAYNAGPHRVEAWLPENHDMEAMRWIETIPFTETREYVSNVLAYMVIYEHRMQRSVTRLSERMPPVPARNPVTITQAENTSDTVEKLAKITENQG